MLRSKQPEVAVTNGRDALRRVRCVTTMPSLSKSTGFAMAWLRKALKGVTYTDGGERSVTPGGTTDICQALKGRQNNLPPLAMPRRFPSPFQG